MPSEEVNWPLATFDIGISHHRLIEAIGFCAVAFWIIHAIASGACLDDRQAALWSAEITATPLPGVICAVGAIDLSQPLKQWVVAIEVAADQPGFATTGGGLVSVNLKAVGLQCLGLGPADLGAAEGAAIFWLGRSRSCGGRGLRRWRLCRWCLHLWCLHLGSLHLWCFEPGGICPCSSHRCFG